MLRGCVILRHGEGESVSVALPLTQPRNIKLKIYAVSSQCLKHYTLYIRSWVIFIKILTKPTTLTTFYGKWVLGH